MKTLTSILFFIVTAFTLSAQEIIQGSIADEKGYPLAGANVYLKGTYFGATTDASGSFKFEAETVESAFLIVDYLGYKSFEKELKPVKSQTIQIVMEESSTNINAVTITAGAFEASDEKKAVALRPLDIVTTASSQGDIYGSLNTLPGTTRVGEDGGIFVRGGEGYEAKTFMDGMLVQSPYTSTMPDVPTRGRFSPFLFNGAVFSTGGYSAEYGQALSSALILKTNALPEKDVSSIMLMSVGAGFSHTKRWENTSVSLEGNYANLYPYYQLVKQDIDWTKAPESLGGTMIFRQRTGKNGMIKSFVSYSHDNSEMNYPNYLNGLTQKIDLSNNNLYANTVYNDKLSERWYIMSGISYTNDYEGVEIDEDKVKTTLNDYHAKLTLSNIVNEDVTLNFGSEIINTNYLQDYYSNTDNTNYHMNFNDVHWATFAESEIRISSKFASRVGVRTEYSGLNQLFRVVPRVSLARKLTTYSQLSFAYGVFNQDALNEYRKFNNKLDGEQAAHYIINYQYIKNDRILRCEAYYKDYNKLVKYQLLNLPEPETYTNSGSGYARGIDIFWRDRYTFSNVDYYFSYSFIDTQRDYKNFTKAAPPIYASKHNFSAVYKGWISKITTQIGLTYSVSSGRPYFNPNNPDFMADRTKPYHDLSCNASHLRTIFGKQAIIHLSISNVLGFDNVFGYNYSTEPDENGIYQAYAVKPAAKRFIVLVFMLSLK